MGRATPESHGRGAASPRFSTMIQSMHSKRNQNTSSRNKLSAIKTVVPNPKSTAVCVSCGAIYEKKRWFENAVRSAELKHDTDTTLVQCPACVRAKADYPEGILTLSGDFLGEHSEEILHLITSVSKRERARDTLCRLMGIKTTPGVIIVKTTNERLVRKLGHAIHASYDGELTFAFSHDVRLTRVRWHRDAPGRNVRSAQSEKRRAVKK